MMTLSSETIDAAATISSATLHEAAGRVGALPSRIKPVRPSMRVCGPAFPVLSPAGDNLWLHHAIYAAPAGAVLVVDTGTALEFGYWGEIMSEAAKARGLGGLVIDGGVRDSEVLAQVGFPIFPANLCISGTGKDPMGRGSLGEPVRIGDILVHAGDLVVGDADGVVVIAAADAAEMVARSAERDRKEAAIIERLRSGESTIDIYGLPSTGSGA